MFLPRFVDMVVSQDFHRYPCLSEEHVRCQVTIIPQLYPARESTRKCTLAKCSFLKHKQCSVSMYSTTGKAHI